MKSNRIILVRHGESLGNVDKSVYATTPDHAVDLTDKGMAQARQAGQLIKEVVNAETLCAYYSPWARARQTYLGIKEGIADNIVLEQEEVRLREQDWGHYKEVEFLAAENRARKDFGKFYFRLSDGESGADVYDRVSTFLESLYRNFQKPHYPQNTVIVTHGVTLLVFLMRWFKWTVEEYEQYYIPANGQVVIMELQDDDKYQITTALKKR